MTPRLKEIFNKEIQPNLKEQLGLKNIYMSPRIEKVILNMGLGLDGTDSKILKSCEEDMSKITGQKPVVTKFKKSVANFKTRKGSKAGLKITLRKNKMYDVTVVGGGPAGATAAQELAKIGRKVALIDKAGRIKPCGGAIPPILINDLKIPDEQVVAKIKTATQLFAVGSFLIALIFNNALIMLISNFLLFLALIISLQTGLSYTISTFKK